MYAALNDILLFDVFVEAMEQFISYSQFLHKKRQSIPMAMRYTHLAPMVLVPSPVEVREELEEGVRQGHPANPPSMYSNVTRPRSVRPGRYG